MDPGSIAKVSKVRSLSVYCLLFAVCFLPSAAQIELTNLSKYGTISSRSFGSERVPSCCLETLWFQILYHKLYILSPMLIIRLQRTGKKNAPDFRLVLAEKESPVNKKVVEILGSYNPKQKVFTVRNEDRLKYWVAQRVELSATVHNLLVTKGYVNAPKVKAFTTPKKPAAPVEAVAPAVKAEATAPAVEATAPEAPVETPTPEATPAV